MDETELKKKAKLIFIPSPGIGHLSSALEFAKLLINRYNHLSITILCIKLTITPFSDSYIKSALSSQSQIELVDVPEIEPLPQELLLKPPLYYVWTFMQCLAPHVKETVQTILSSNLNSGSEPAVALIVDFVCASMINVGKELSIPSYLYMTSNAGFLSLMLSLRNRRIEDIFNDSDPHMLIPGISNLVPSKVLPDALLNKDGGYVTCYMLAQKFIDTKGIIVNTFLEIEKYAIDELSNGKNPPIYAIGPLINLKSHPNSNLEPTKHDMIMRFLDEQETSSVVFLCFGSRGSFGPSQTRQIAIALRRSGVRFLWAMRSPPNKANDDENPLPEGFLEWMEGRGMICEWTPQVEILAHKAICGFVSHCGWNSILESLWFGVPILTWPIYAEQQLNAFRMVKEFELALELKLEYRTGSDVVIVRYQKNETAKLY
ncbi:hypothetical protein PIB30_089036, partial [Stylosanthes scabra]|nr:hypothetical protein [Stylosanthes scabra]